MRGTWGYVAPEWISGVAITAKADVYSYGMTLMELIGGRRNVETAAAEEEEEDGEKCVVDPQLAGDYDVRQAERAALVAVWCIQDQETNRPTMGQVVKILEGTVEVTSPPLPQLLQALISGDSFRRAASRASTSPGDDDDDNYSEEDSEISVVNGR
ncbi:unnamed protein product [Spirodela intermedia]|uniref:Protein kinase domain-containing protein n=1 Tax=Spirodela intermedia TaxID=51605 RepID=A0A7I8ICK4_SPIIN|nr:unnamed protein product [Spirodela intermedia]CAA6655486.1 unnamed protein product [Spirodela intermedia]